MELLDKLSNENFRFYRSKKWKILFESLSPFAPFDWKFFENWFS